MKNMLKTLFTLEDFPVGTILYWVFTVNQKDDDACYDKFQVVGASDSGLMIRGLDSMQIERVTKEEIEFSRERAIIVPEYVYNHIHNLPNNSLNDQQKLQLILLTGSTAWDALIKKAALSSSDYHLTQQRQG